MAKRPSMASLADWAEGRLDAQQGGEIEHAIATDPETAATAAWVADVLHIAGRVPLEDPPAGLSDRLRALFDDHRNIPDDS